MEGRKEKDVGWVSVPQFGDWDQKGKLPDYSMDFSKIRESRKQHKRDISRASIGNEEELVATQNKEDHHHPQTTDHVQLNPHSDSPTARRGLFSFFNCLKA
ncbi:hypothetical protein NE237_018579 [Protea cynaroides]|uniref:RIN4 pathogenic type III effector avirulence factor Avr cleavage site domain-containing protein n=1 Tax=Protea cynaroides TaxID=273540 RepID=A0A9Q0QP23_9MAGN|nr:hypothetical protein NE237_018579 [Protea cynaroides]